MSARMDVRKAELWRECMQRYGSSGCSVVEFCQSENIATHLFYYWQRRLSSADKQSVARRVPVSRTRPGEHSKVNAIAGGKPASGSQTRSLSQTEQVDTVSIVQIALGNHAVVSIPAHCHETIQRVLGMAYAAALDSQRSEGMFQPIQLR